MAFSSELSLRPRNEVVRPPNQLLSKSGILSWKRHFMPQNDLTSFVWPQYKVKSKSIFLKKWYFELKTLFQASKWGCEASKSTFVKKWYFELKTLFHASKWLFELLRHQMTFKTTFLKKKLFNFSQKVVFRAQNAIPGLKDLRSSLWPQYKVLRP